MSDNQKELLANIPPFGLRMQPDLKERIKEAAEQNSRSMNSEIVARLEAYDGLHDHLKYLVAERDSLAEQLKVTEEEYVKQKLANRGLQELLGKFANDEQATETAKNEIEKRFNELKEQTDYLESLKAELLTLSKEREGLAEDLVKHQREAIEVLVESNRTATTVLRNLANAPTPEMIGATLTPELFDKLFTQLVKVEETLGRSKK